MKPKKLFLELDALLDSRLGTLNLLYPDVVATLDLGRYLTRQSDHFDWLDIDQSLYDLAYRDRDTVTLKQSVLTNVLALVKSAFHQHVATVSGPKVAVLELDLNVYPYVMTLEERECMRALLEFKLGGVVKVNTINVRPQALTLQHIADNYHTVFLYNWVEWACAIESSFLNNERAPLATVVTPKLLHGGTIPENPDPTIKALLEATEPYAAMEFALADHIGLSFDQIGFFSIAH